MLVRSRPATRSNRAPRLRGRPQEEPTMKHARVIAHRTKPDGSRVMWVACPICDRRHWLPDAPAGRCSRRPGEFTTKRK